MKALIKYPLPANNWVEAHTLDIGTSFLRIAGPNNETQPDIWILLAKGVNTVDILNPLDMGIITGVAKNMPVVPYPTVLVPESCV